MGWTVGMGDFFQFEIVEAKRYRDGSFGSDADLNGTFPTKLDALESLIAGQEQTRAGLNEQIARAKRMRARLRRKQP